MVPGSLPEVDAKTEMLSPSLAPFGWIIRKQEPQQMRDGQCWSLFPESDALWRIYSTVDKDTTTGRNRLPDEEGLRVRTTPRRLLRAFWDTANAEIRQGLFFGRVRYSYARDALEAIAAELVRSLGTREADPIGTVESLLRKREPFAHEDECRLVLVDMRGAPIQQNVFDLFVGDPNEVFKHVTLDPRISREDAQNRERRLRSYGFTGEIVQSQLYKPVRIELERAVTEASAERVITQ